MKFLSLPPQGACDVGAARIWSTVATRLSGGSIQLDDGRIVYADTPIMGQDLLEILPLFTPPPAWPFVGGGGGGSPGPVGPPGPPGPVPSNHVEAAHSLYAEATLPDQTPVFPPMVYDGAVVASIPVPSGKLVITDAFFGFGFVFWTIEVDLGSGFVPLANFGFVLLSPMTSEVKRFKSPITINGGPGVAMRLKATAATPPTSPLDVNATIRLYTEP